MKLSGTLSLFALTMFVISLAAGVGQSAAPFVGPLPLPWAQTNRASTKQPTFGILLPSSFRRSLMQADEKVRFWMHHFTSGEGRESFQSALERGQVYKRMIQNTLIRHGVPTSFYYLPLIESAYKQDAETEKNMVGLWQLASPTGSRFGLDIDDEIDERLDPQRSTQAAARYLHLLYRRFRSWTLVAAAYNVGENRLLRAIHAGHTHDFWSLARRGLIPIETQRFVPQFLAAVVLGENLDYYHLEISEPDSPDEG